MTLAPKDPAVHQRVLAQIELCAAEGKRAPLGFEIRGGSATTAEMAKRGLIKVEIYGKNWRVIELSDGSRTAEPPFPNTGPYRILGQFR